MAGPVFELNTDELRGMFKRVKKAKDTIERADVLEGVAGLLESQTKRRIADEKRDPDGRPWKRWSPEYARTRRPQHSLNVSTGSLRDDIAAEVSGKTQVDVFTVREYGGAVDAVRPFLGLSRENASEIEQHVIDFLQGVL